VQTLLAKAKSSAEPAQAAGASEPALSWRVACHAALLDRDKGRMQEPLLGTATLTAPGVGAAYERAMGTGAAMARGAVRMAGRRVRASDMAG
jgi:hypothetical protein